MHISIETNTIDAPKQIAVSVPAAGKQTDKQSAKNDLDALFSSIKVKKQQKVDKDKAVQRQEAKERAEKLAYRKHLEALEAERRQCLLPLVSHTAL
ncbi:hypothetical protein DYB32_010498 [Aphanomyces invadans]|uniref:Uncharacterized protein n=1 Tax=Aphanomyces invadans TaxID=157072 RepID=A0A3R6Y433_9STRA|nr:hypothetical protein DYB32_010498 [Aphanomyces invadans]